MTSLLTIHALYALSQVKGIIDDGSYFSKGTLLMDCNLLAPI